MSTSTIKKPTANYRSASKRSLPTAGRIGLPSLGLHASERRLMLGAVDLLLLNLSLLAALWLTTELIRGPEIITSAWKWFVTLVVVWVVTATILDVYNLARSASASASLVAISAASLITTVAYLAIPWFTPPIINRSQGFLFVLFSLATLGGWRFFYARFFVQPTFHRRVLVIGAGQSGQALVQALHSDYARQDANPYRGTGYHVIGFVDDDPALQDELVAGVPVMGNSQALLSLARTLATDELVIAITYTSVISDNLMEAILDCREAGLPITMMSTIYERLTERIAVEHMGQNIELASGRSHDDALFRLYQGWKRITDIGGGLVGLVLLGLVAPCIWLANRFFAPGPLFFYQERVGLGGRPFVVMKFRSMIVEAEHDCGPKWAAANDNRVTAVGSLLRKTHLDELPQVFNVLSGQMSLVGPRPERPEFVCQFSQQIPFYRARHAVKPGITGWAQIHQDYGDSIAGVQEKLEFDLYYVKNADPALDSLIILRTITKVLGLRGR